MNVFEQDFILVPINMSLHWSLAVICYPGELIKQLAVDVQDEATRVLDNDDGTENENEWDSEVGMEGGGRERGAASAENLHN
jgi:Ulp1 family protease